MVRVLRSAVVMVYLKAALLVSSMAHWMVVQSELSLVDWLVDWMAARVRLIGSAAGGLLDLI